MDEEDEKESIDTINPDSNKETKRNFTERVRENPWIISTFVLGVVILILVVGNFFGITGKIGMTGKVVSENEAGESLVDYLNGIADSEVKLIDVENFGSLYLVTVEFEGDEIPFYMTKDGTYYTMNLLSIENEQSSDDIEKTAQITKVTDSTFLENQDEICVDESGKPYVLLFSTTWCPHCEWIKETFDSLTKEDFASKVNIQHWEVDTGDNTLTTNIEKQVPDDMLDLYELYNPQGSIPTFVFGCKYTRIGNGYESQQDLNAELEDFRFIINKLI